LEVISVSVTNTDGGQLTCNAVNEIPSLEGTSSRQ